MKIETYRKALWKLMFYNPTVFDEEDLAISNNFPQLSYLSQLEELDSDELTLKLMESPYWKLRVLAARRINDERLSDSYLNSEKNTYVIAELAKTCSLKLLKQLVNKNKSLIDCGIACNSELTGDLAQLLISRDRKSVV